MKSTLLIIPLMLLIIPISTLVKADEPGEYQLGPVTVSFDGSFPITQGQGSLTVAGKGYWRRTSLEPGDSVSLSEFYDAPDGPLRFQFVDIPSEDSYGPANSISGIARVEGGQITNIEVYRLPSNY